MGRLNLVIADEDRHYLESLVEFLTTNYSQRFRISSFTNKSNLNNFLNECDEKIDVLLVAGEMYADSIPEGKTRTLILLSDGIIQRDNKVHSTILKYQHGDRLASEIINLYSVTNADVSIMAEKQSATRVVAVYSPAGGTGKTTIAASSCIQCSRKGLKVFYLNLEDIDTTPMFFDTNEGENLSGIIYYLKEKSRNLHLKIEGLRRVEPEYGIHYFAPPDSVRERAELLPDELVNLLDSIKKLNFYDVVFLDMSSGVNLLNLEALKASDDIFLVVAEDLTSNIKFKTFINELDILNQKTSHQIGSKITFIINKSELNTPTGAYENVMLDKADMIKIPYVQEMSMIQKISHVLNGNAEFCKRINMLINRFYSERRKVAKANE